jgi:hypothetical protein
MQLLCTECQTAFAGASHCPVCGGRLVSPQEAHILRKKRRKAPPRISEPTAAGRVAVGVLVALGGYLGLREWVGAGLLGAGIAGDEWWETETAAWVTLGLRAASAIVGGLVAGAGRVGGWMTGTLAGCVAGGLLLSADVAAHPAGPGPIAYLGALAAAVAGLVAGTLGTFLWPSPVELPRATSGSRGSSLLRLAREQEEARKGRPTQWLRIVIGVSIAFSGIVAADVVRTGLSKGSIGNLHMGSAFHAPVVCLELAAAVIFFGGATAGASTGAGVRHGVIAGLLAGIAAVAITATRHPNVFPAVEGYFWLSNIPNENIRDTAALLELLIAVWVVTVIGGWFGGQLLPPLASKAQLRRLGSGEHPVVRID